MRNFLPAPDLGVTALLLVGSEGEILEASEPARKIFGLSASPSDGLTLKDVLPYFKEPLEKVLASWRPSLNHQVTWQNRRLDLALFPVSLKEDKPAVCFLITPHQDGISPDPATIEPHCKDILDTFTDGVWVCDATGIVLWLNLAAKQTNQVRDDQVLGKNLAQVLGEDFERSVTLQVQRELVRKRLIRKTKSGKQIMVTGYPILDPKGGLTLIVVTERDFTELNRLRLELEESRSLAQEYRSEITKLLSKQAELADLVARSPSMQRILRTALKVARSVSTVVIHGESGVGKSLLASLIHRNSNMKDGPFIQVDCGAIPETLIESELFGYEPGAFTGAGTRGKPGLFELAEGGTLFLDEVGDLPLNMQMKLLRFVETNELLRVGGTRPRKVNARVLAATHRNLNEMVENGRFRRDLFFRLNVVPLAIPPLRERPEDIPPIALNVLEKFNQSGELKKRLSPEVLDRLMLHDFPGNVRELINIMEQMIVMSDGEMITTADLPAHLRTSLVDGSSDLSSVSTSDLSLKEAVRKFESRIISVALHHHKSIAAAARSLGIDPSTLWRKVQRQGPHQNIE